MNRTSLPAVSVSTLSFAYQRRLILDHASFSVAEGEYLGVIGPNGGGKTTLLRLLLGFLEPLDGEVRIFGEPPRSCRRRVGYVPQALQYDTSFPISTLEVVISGRLSHLPWWGRYSKEDYHLAHEALSLVGLEELTSSSFSRLSGGQRQRALIARAMVDHPALLILDEPTANLDVESREEIYTLLEGLKGRTTILMVTHDLRTVVDRIDSVICVEQTVTRLDPDKICEHFAIGLYHHPLLGSDCSLPKEHSDAEQGEM